MMKRIEPEASVKELPGVGTARENALAAAGIFTAEDMLYHFPRSYQDRGNVVMLAEAPHDGSRPVSLVLTVATAPQDRMIRRGMSIMKFRAFDDSGSCEVVYFNQSFLKKTFTVGATYRFWGKLTAQGSAMNPRLQLASPQFELWEEEKPLPKLVPVYPLTAGISQKIMSGLAAAVLQSTVPLMTDPLNAEIRNRYGLCPLQEALRNIHHPADFTSLAAARRRLAFDEMLTFALSVRLLKEARPDSGAPAMADTDITPLLSKIPYALTGAQQRSVSEIAADLQKNTPMSRILVGDVGSGKTICAAAAAYIAVKNGYQAAIMAPTEILAVQHYADLAPLFESLGYRCGLLTGSTSAAEKRRILDYLETGVLDLVIGTHALIEGKVKFRSLGLVIADEQHRFGVDQRAALAEKADVGGDIRAAHMLVMSATPIPRTLSIVMFGDLDLSLIDEMPPGRQRVDTFVVNESYRPRLNAFIRKHVSEGHQVYIVCPTVEEAEPDLALEAAESDSDSEGALTFEQLRLIYDGGEEQKKAERTPPLKSAVGFAKLLQEEYFSDLAVGFIHGKMKSSEKDAVMRRFSAGELHILVSTTVIEVGVNVPNATLMIVENAERFGLSQLHQLRGRVGRGSAKSYCILVSDAEGENAVTRLSVMKSTYDGYRIAEQDLAQRGPGDFLAAAGSTVRQHGSIKFKLSDEGDGEESIMQIAFDTAKDLIENDPALNAHPLLWKKVSKMGKIARNTLN